MRVPWFSCIIMLIASSPTSPVSAASDVAATTNLLSSYDLHLPDPVSLGNVTFTCQILQKLFPRNETFLANSVYYTPLYEIPWSQTCWLEPACVVTPWSANDLSKAILVLNVFNTKFATRSGGHTVAPGFSGIGGDGVLLALQNLNNLAISSDKKTMTVGTGNRWGAVYKYAAQNGVNIVGGREPMVGVGGFLLGGGLSLFYNTYGLAMDQITRYQVVLTNGTIVNATPTLNADLYKALKGGLANFGIVAEFDIMTNSYMNIYYEIYIYAPENTPALIEAYGNYLADPNTDPNSSVEVDITANYSLAFYGYNGYTNKPAVFDPFYKIPSSSTLFPPTNGTVNDVVFGVDGSTVSVGSTYESTYSHKVTSGAFMLESYQAFLDLNAKLLPGMTFYYIPQGITPGLVSAGKARNGGNMLNIASNPQAWVDVYIDYVDVQNTKLAQTVVDAFVANMTQKAEIAGLSLPYLYVNNAAAAQKPLQAYGGQSLAFFKSVASRYDPRGIMQTLQNTGYLVSNE